MTVMILSLYVVSLFLDWLLKPAFISGKFSTTLGVYKFHMSLKQQRRVVSRFLLIFVATAALIVNLCSASRLVFLAEPIGLKGAEHIHIMFYMLTAQFIYELLYNIEFELVNIFHHLVTSGLFLVTMFLTYETQQPQIFLLLTVVFSFHQTLAPPHHIVLVFRRFLVSPVLHPSFEEPIRKLMIGTTVWFAISQSATHLYTLYVIIRLIVTPANDGQSVYDCQQPTKFLVELISSIGLIALACAHVQDFRILLGMCKKSKPPENVISVLNPLGAV